MCPNPGHAAPSKTPRSAGKLGTWSTLSIGLGGMVGGGIFAITGLAIEVTRGAVPLAFLLAGLVALLTCYSYLRLTLRYPGEGGTVEFLNRAFGEGVFTGAMNILLLFSYVVLVSIYAYAFGSYGSGFFPESERGFWTHTLASGNLMALLLVNGIGGRFVVRSENLFNAVKLVLLGIFIAVGLSTPIEWDRLSPSNFVSPIAMVSGATLIFLNYEGFELIANASKEIANPKRSLPIAYFGGVIMVIVIYMLIAVVVLGHLDFEQIAAQSDNSLSAAANQLMGRAGYITISIAALLATSSAVNATLFSTGRLTYIIAESGELPKRFERTFNHQHLVGAILTVALALIVTNFVPLDAIATMGSAGFLLIFMAVNLANVRLARQTASRAWISAIAAIVSAISIVVLCVEVDENPATRNHLWILVGMIVSSLVIEMLYRRATGRQANLRGQAGSE